jgi:hypothetical protein
MVVGASVELARLEFVIPTLLMEVSFTALGSAASFAEAMHLGNGS